MAKKATNEKLCIVGEQPFLSWLMIFAFRYGVKRHYTQALEPLFPLFKQNITLLHDEFLIQMIRDINLEFRIAKDGGETPYYLEPLRKFCIEELKNRCNPLEQKGIGL